MASITFWTRLEPRTRAASGTDPLVRGLRAQVRDPLWLLTRQWQVGEFRGEDAGSPVSAAVQIRAVPLTTYRPSLDGAGTALGTEPLEVRVEAEAVELGLRGAAQLGSRFEAMLRAAGLDAVVADFRGAYPIASAAPAGEIADRRSQRVRAVLAGRVTDGVTLYAAAKAAAPSPPSAPALDPAVASQAATVVAAFVAYRESLYREPPEASPWVSPELHYEFSVGSETSDGTLTLDAPEHAGGHLDWHAFSGGQTAISGGAAQAVHVRRRTFLPNALGFSGMPRSRWWDFEDAVTDWGALDAERVDLAKLLVMEFALLYSDDWHQLPVTLPVGTLARVDRLVVENSFGERTDIPAAGTSGDWRMFSLGSSGDLAERLLVAPTLPAMLEGLAIEEVVFLRDDMAAMAWAVEGKLQGPLDAPVDGFESYRERLRAEPPPEAPARTDGGPEIRYVVGTTVPDNWIPLVPVTTPARSLMLRRGLMQRPTEAGLEDVPARGRILEPWHPFYVVDEAVPQAGARVRRAFQRTRWSDGSTHVWIGRRAGAGRGPGWSGLAFDIVERLAEPSG